MFKEIIRFFSYNREENENILEDENNIIGKMINKFISFLVVVFIFVLILETVDDLHIFLEKPFFLLDAFISVVFALEYTYRFSKSKQKIHFFASPNRMVDLLSFLPFFF
jgi:voltage-gated potassium channel